MYVEHLVAGRARLGVDEAYVMERFTYQPNSTSLSYHNRE
jgi:hypothetical protein